MQSPPEELIPLRSTEAEMSVLGSMLVSDRAAEEVVNRLTEDDFYQPAHREIFRAMLQLINNAKPVDLVTLKDELTARETLRNVGGVDYLVQVAESVPSPANVLTYARIVQDKATMRRLEDAGREIVGVVHNPEIPEADEKVDRAEQLLFEVGRRRLGKDFVHVKSLAQEFFLDVDRIIETGEPMLGVSTGYYDLDDLTTGFYAGDFVIVAARPSMGKSALALNFALHVARKGEGNVAVFTLEMSGPQVVRRMVSMISGVSSGALKKSHLRDDEYAKLADACEVLYGLPIYIDDSSDVSGVEMRGKCRRLKQEGGLALVMVDYLQLMRSNTRRPENRVQEIGEIARSLKALAKDLQVPVVALSQLNRGVESRENKRPLLSDLRESGSIEAEADLVMLIYRDDYYKAREQPVPGPVDPEHVEEAEINVAKHRNGPVGMVKLGFQPSFARFLNLKS